MAQGPIHRPKKRPVLAVNSTQNPFCSVCAQEVSGVRNNPLDHFNKLHFDWPIRRRRSSYIPTVVAYRITARLPFKLLKNAILGKVQFAQPGFPKCLALEIGRKVDRGFPTLGSMPGQLHHQSLGDPFRNRH
jgi:hypothetical protein